MDCGAHCRFERYGPPNPAPPVFNIKGELK